MGNTRRSTFSLLGLPGPFGVLILTLGLVLFLARFLPDVDLGIFRIPKSSPTLNVVGPIAFILSLALFVPAWPRRSEASESLNAAPQSTTESSQLSGGDVTVEPMHPNWPIYHNGNYEVNGRFSGQVGLRLLVGSVPLQIVTFEAVFYFPKRQVCVNRTPRLKLDGQDCPYAADCKSLVTAIPLAAGGTYRLEYLRNLRPPPSSEVPKDIETGSVTVEFRYRRAVESQLTTKSLTYHFDNGRLIAMSPKALLSPFPYEQADE